MKVSVKDISRRQFIHGDDSDNYEQEYRPGGKVVHLGSLYRSDSDACVYAAGFVCDAVERGNIHTVWIVTNDDDRDFVDFYGEII